MQHYSQSNDPAKEDEVVSSTASKHASDDYDNDDDGEEDDRVDENYTASYSGVDSTGNFANPQLNTLLNGHQWQAPAAGTRRTARVDYSYDKSAEAVKQDESTRKGKVSTFIISKAFRCTSIESQMRRLAVGDVQASYPVAHTDCSRRLQRMIIDHHLLFPTVRHKHTGY